VLSWFTPVLHRLPTEVSPKRKVRESAPVSGQSLPNVKIIGFDEEVRINGDGSSN
jgi:hypothetical protein